jgi:exodeoxyribonuclease VII small subunit
MSYDETIHKAETIIAQLEQSEAISLDEYKRLAAEASALLKQCKSLLTEMDKDMSVGVENL